ncbi:MAG: hypothetical protein SF052_18785 [Bacteroidia bacterium]|nr:hypothetical protein [Bacteroidia bacterium]
MTNTLCFILSCFLICIFPFYGNSQSFEQPVDYHNYLASEHIAITQKHIEYISYAVHSDDYSEIEKRRDDVIHQIIQSISKVSNITPYKGDVKLKEVAIAVFEQYLEVFNVEFSEAIDLKRDSKSSYEAMEKFFQAQDKAEDKLAKASDRFDIAQLEFVGKHQLSFEEKNQRASWKVKMISEVNKYTNDLYLHYFRIKKADSAFEDAWDKKDAGQMEKTKLDLLKYASQANATIQARGDFYGNREFYEATRKVVLYYQSLASKEYTVITRVLNNPETRTNKDVEAYNQIVERIPEEKYTLDQNFFQTRRELLKKYIPNTVNQMKY